MASQVLQNQGGKKNPFPKDLSKNYSIAEVHDQD
jgi:hypothetical protein